MGLVLALIDGGVDNVVSFVAFPRPHFARFDN